MADETFDFQLPADLPENWEYGQVVAPDGTDVGLSEQHGFNYLNRQVNNTQKALNRLGTSSYTRSQIDNKLTGKSDTGHIHDDRYYTESEMDTKLSGKASTSHTHKYAGSASAGGPANSAVKLDTSAGSATQPVYFSGGKPVACTYTLGKSVPSNAVFTDTNTWRGIQNNLTSTSTTESLSAAQGKWLNDNKAAANHTHSAATQSAAGLMSAADKKKLDGVAAGATGSNISASGTNYIRFTDGTQICWGSLVATSETVTGGSVKVTVYYFTFPVPFVNTGYIATGMMASSSGHSDDYGFYWISKETGRIKVQNAYNASSRSSGVICIGRWK